MTGFPWRRFAVFDAIGAATWATVNAVIGLVGGKAFQTWLSVLVSFAAAVAVGGLAELVWWIADRRRTGPDARLPPAEAARRPCGVAERG